MPSKTSKKQRDVNQELLDDLQEVDAYNRGERELRTHTFVKVSPPAEIRKRLNLSQQGFAARLGVSVRTVQEWEHGRRKPSGPAYALLRIADQQPDVFLKLR